MTKLIEILKLAGVCAGAALAGCAAAPQQTMPGDGPVFSPVVVEQDSHDGAIFSAGTELALFEDIKAKRVGDILTVLLVEKTSGQKSSDSNLNKTTEMDVSTPTYGGSTRPNMAVDLNSGHTFTGESGSSQSNSLSGSIAVTISEVLPGGNLRVQGEKWIRINQGNEYIRLSGIVRPRDIGADNTLYSTQVADARISYSGNGANHEVNTPGWVARLLFSPLWPF